MSASSRYLAVLIPVEGGFEAYIPDLPGCIGSATSIEVLEALLQEAVPIHLRALQERGIEVPPPKVFVKYIVATERLV
jgi:predicted RNase H-like HicB family nuclease